MAPRLRLKEILFKLICLGLFYAFNSCSLTEAEVCGAYYHRNLGKQYTIKLHNGIIEQIFIKENGDSVVAINNYIITMSSNGSRKGKVVAPDAWLPTSSIKAGARKGGCVSCELEFDNNSLRYYEYYDGPSDEFVKYKSCKNGKIE